MKHKKFLTCSSIIQIGILFSQLIFIKKYLNGIISQYNLFYKETNQQIYQTFGEIYNNYGVSVVSIVSIIMIALNSIILYKLLKDKNHYIIFVVIASLIGMFISESTLIYYLSIINLIVVFKNRLIKKKLEKSDIEKVENIYREKLIFYILLFLSFFVVPIMIGFLPMNYINKSIMNDLIMLCLSLLVFWKELKVSFLFLIKNFKKYFIYIIKNQIVMFAVYYFVCAMVVIIKNGEVTTVNQSLAETLPMGYLLFASVICAPIVEEVVFRGTLRKLIKKDTVYIIITAVIFGLLHTISEKTLFDMIVLSLPYSVLGGYFAYIYTKTNNICCSISLHLFHNLLACILIFLT